MTTPASADAPAEPVLRGAVTPQPPLLVEPAEVARRLGVRGVLTLEQMQTVTDAILDAQADVIGMLNRTIFPEVVTLPGETPIPAFLSLDDPRVWRLPERFDDKVTIVSRTPNAQDPSLFDLVVHVGLDARVEEPIVRYVRAHAVESLRLDLTSGLGERAVTSLSVEGQSISYEKRPAAGAMGQQVGGLPTWKTISRYRRVTAYRARTVPYLPFPYGGR